MKYESGQPGPGRNPEISGVIPADDTPEKRPRTVHPEIIQGVLDEMNEEDAEAGDRDRKIERIIHDRDDSKYIE